MTSPATVNNFMSCLRVVEEMVKYVASRNYDGATEWAIKDHIAGLFTTTYNKYCNLSQHDRNLYLIEKKHLFRLMKAVNYLNRRHIFATCTLEPLCKLYMKALQIRNLFYKDSAFKSYLP
jgi:hypothetical protein